MEKRQIRAVYYKETIRVYQAYPEVIAKEAVSLGTFGPHFKMGRMTWIVGIEDITDCGKELDSMRKAGIDITERLPKERIYESV